MPEQNSQAAPSSISRFLARLFTSSSPGDQAPQVATPPRPKNTSKKTDPGRDFTRAIFQVLPDLLFVFDRRGNFIDYKPAHFGGPRAPAEHFIGKNIAEVLPLHVTEVSLQAMQEAFEHGGVRTAFYEGIVKGKEHIFEARYIAMNKSRALALIRDVTEQRALEERLEQRNFEMKTLVENLLVGIVMEDEERRITHVNSELFKLFNLPPLSFGEAEEHSDRIATQDSKRNDDMMQEGGAFTRRIAELMVEPDKFIEHSNDLTHHLQKVEGEVWKLKDERSMELSYMPVFQEGICRGHLWMYRDITEHTKIDRLKSEFVSVASHQLRTPLAGIKWMAELLLKGKVGALAPEQQELVDHLAETNERMITLVNDLLNVSRIERGEGDKLAIQSEDFIAFMHSIIDEVRPSADKRQVSMMVSGKVPAKLMLNFDKEKLRQAVMNIISNAVKYSRSGGVVEIKIATQKDLVTLSCRDEGIGIPEEEQERLFQKFFRASNAVKHEAEGTGLGLYIARAIVEAHGGKLWFTSVPQKGTTFFISLPKRS